MHFKLLKNKEKTKENYAKSNSNINEKTREKSTGRSMVEMLGVLAIIGVLSIGGIQGYTMAMRHHRANEIITFMNKYASLLYTRCQSASLNGETVDDAHIANQAMEIFDLVGAEAYTCPKPIEIESSGLGALPQGIKKPFFDIDTVYGPHYYLIPSDSGDILRMYLSFESKELCETVINILGTSPSTFFNGYTNLIGMCEKNSQLASKGLDGYIGLLYFIMN